MIDRASKKVKFGKIRSQSQKGVNFPEKNMQENELWGYFDLQTESVAELTHTQDHFHGK